MPITCACGNPLAPVYWRKLSACAAAASGTTDATAMALTSRLPNVHRRWRRAVSSEPFGVQAMPMRPGGCRTDEHEDQRASVRDAPIYWYRPSGVVSEAPGG